MKKRIAAYVAIVALIVVAIFTAAAYSNQGTEKSASTATCTKFVDANKDGVCDMAAQCHANGGKCAGDCKNCPHIKDGKCDPAKCAGHCGSAQQQTQGGCKSQCQGRGSCGRHK